MSLPTLSPASPVLSNVSTTAINLGNLIVVTPSQVKGYQPQNPPNADGTPSKLPPPKSFLFDYEGEQTADLLSDITDHPIEDNTYIEDQISLKPIKISTKGYISELNDIIPDNLSIVRDVVQKLTAINSYAPAVNLTAQLAYNAAFQAYQIAQNLINASVAAWGTLSGSPNGVTVISGDDNFPTTILPNQNKQQTAFQTFYGYWHARTRFTIQTPWAIFQDMAIERIHPIQSEDTNTFTTFECTFKQIRTTQSATTLPQNANSQGRLSSQSTQTTSFGTSTPPNRLSLTDGLAGTGA